MEYKKREKRKPEASESYRSKEFWSHWYYSHSLGCIVHLFSKFFALILECFDCYCNSLNEHVFIGQNCDKCFFFGGTQIQVSKC